MISSMVVGEGIADAAETILEVRKTLWGDSLEPYPSWKEFLTNRAKGFSSLPTYPRKQTSKL